MARPPDFGKRLLPTVVDRLAEQHPDHVLYAFPRNGKLEEGFRDVSALEFANAVNRTAWWIESLVGRSTTFETIAYVGPHDLRYALITLGAVKAGFQALFLSPRNSIEGQIGLLRETNCTTFALPSQRHESVAKVLEAGKGWLKVLEIPEVEELLGKELVPLYPYNKTWEEAWQEPFFVAHTSGTTGVPKKITCRHGLAACWDSVQRIGEGPDGTPVRHRYREDQAIFCTYPFFHIMGIMVGIWTAPFFRSTCIIGPPQGVPSLALVEQVMGMRHVDGWVLPPPMVEQLAIEPDLLKRFGDAEFVLTGGGPVSHERGIAVSRVVKLRNLIGATETLTLQCWDIADPDDWFYFRWHPCMNVDMREVDPGLYECWVVRKPELSPYQGAFHTFPELQEFNYRDLYSRHPDPAKADYWYSTGRSDDIVVLGNGEKIQPADMESVINSHPEVVGSIVVGTGRFQPAILVELRDPTTAEVDRDGLLESIWTVVKKANAIAPAHAQVHRNYIMLAEPGKHLLRADKGSVKRRNTVDLFQEDIDRFYQMREDEYAEEALSGVDPSSLDSIEEGVRNLVARILGVPAGNISPDEDFFGSGLDSLQVFIIVGALRGVLRPRNVSPSRLRELKPQLVYANPTVTRLSSAFYKFVSSHIADGEARNGLCGASLSNSEHGAAAALLKKYTSDLPTASSRPAITRSPEHDGLHVLLTGSTGSLGSYILHELLQQPHVKLVTCLNRAEDGKARQEQANAKRGLPTEFPSAKVSFLQADISKAGFGLPSQTFRELLRSADLFIHNAWPVNFNWDVASFEPHVAGIRNIVDFSAKSALGMGVFFVSSIGSTMSWAADRVVPEDIVNDLSVGSESGYTSSKLVSELVLARAGEVSGVKSTVCRVGQIAGPVLRGDQGAWNKQEWLPTLIATSNQMGLLPSTLGSMDQVDWIPVDVMAMIILELAGISAKPEADGMSHAHHSGPPTAKVFHGVNPRATPWASLVPSVLGKLGPSVRLVSWHEWLDALRKGHQQATSAAAQSMTGLKLLDFFEGLDRAQRPALATAATERESATLRGLDTVHAGWMQLWMEQWGF